MANFEPAGRPPGTLGTAPVPSGKRRFPFFTIILVLAAIVVGVIVWRQITQSNTKQGGRGAFTGPVPVVVGTVEQKNMPVFLDGIGTVQAFNTVTMRSRVDGQLQKLGFQEGQDVRTGDLLAQIDPDPFRTVLEQAQAKKEQDQAQLHIAEIELNRNLQLFSNKIVSADIIDTNKAAIKQITALINADKASVDNAQVQLNYTTIRSPIDGRTGLRQVDVGNIIHSNDTNGVVVVTQLKPISINFTLPEQDLGGIQEHFAKGPLTVLAVDRDNKTVLDTGKLSVIDNQVDPTTGTIRLKATFPNSELRLWPGQFANTRLLLTTRTNAVVVPASVVQRGPEGSYAFVVQDDETVKMQPVTVGFIEQTNAVIDKGLQLGEKVVVDGQYKLQPGSQIRISEPTGTGTNVPAGHGNWHSSTNGAAGKGHDPGNGGKKRQKPSEPQQQ